ncbi:YdcF family protein [Desulfocurvus sp.]|uniref:YdcF family protein n=1 Tax=Desulfocurvus sp. TaxID=2871698 RepID=UPI0025B8CB63|nr:YdcF family protein [Desulfocurvus sp.]MCK9240423.1 YdcF family protein [Desulfocurvus sp.]
MRGGALRRALGRVFVAAGALGLAALLAGAAAVAVVGGMLAVQDAPRPAEVMVVLGGQYHRPVHAARLHARGLAPEIWVSRPKPPQDTALLPLVGVDLPPQEEIYRRLLVRGGVPDAAIHLYGREVQSTAEEAALLARILGERPQGPPATLLVVTSPYHVLRARLIFQAAFPDTQVLAVATPDEPFPSPWWSSQGGAVRVVNETAKLAWYLLGGRFSTSAPAAPRPAPAAGGPGSAP